MECDSEEEEKNFSTDDENNSETEKIQNGDTSDEENNSNKDDESGSSGSEEDISEKDSDSSIGDSSPSDCDTDSSYESEDDLDRLLRNCGENNIEDELDLLLTSSGMQNKENSLFNEKNKLPSEEEEDFDDNLLFIDSFFDEWDDYDETRMPYVYTANTKSMMLECNNKNSNTATAHEKDTLNNLRKYIRVYKEFREKNGIYMENFQSLYNFPISNMDEFSVMRDNSYVSWRCCYSFDTTHMDKENIYCTCVLYNKQDCRLINYNSFSKSEDLKTILANNSTKLHLIADLMADNVFVYKIVCRDFQKMS